MSRAVSQTADQHAQEARLCVVTAAAVEFRAVAELLVDCAPASKDEVKLCRGRIAGHRITLLQSEIGAAGFAQHLAAHLAAARYQALLVVGLAGGLDAKLKPGDAVIYDRCFRAGGATNSREKRLAREENASLVCDPALSEWLAEGLRAAGLPCLRGAGLTAARVVVEAEHKLALGARYGAAAVDMETYQIIAAGARAGVPAATLRVVLDEAGADLPDFNRALKADGSLNGWRLLPALLAHPVNTARFFVSLRRGLRALRLAAAAALCAGRLAQAPAPRRRGQGQCLQAVDN
jgi:nucleoside phosphorylase